MPYQMGVYVTYPPSQASFDHPHQPEPKQRGLYIRVGRHLGVFVRTGDNAETLAQLQALRDKALSTVKT